MSTAGQYPTANGGAPVVGAQLRTNKTLVAFILLTIITFGIYGIWMTARSGEDLNIAASRWDGKRTMNYWLVALLLSWLTLGIYPLIWYHGFAERLGNEQVRRGLPRTISAADWWLWGFLGSIIIVGPFIFAYKWIQASNQINADFNARG